MGALDLEALQKRAYEMARQDFEKIIEHLCSEDVSSMTHSELERELDKQGRELMRKLLQEHLDLRGLCRCRQVVRGVDGVERSQVRTHDRNLETVFGTVSVERAGYGQKGVNSLHPLDAELNLPNEKYSLELRRRVAEQAAKNSFDETKRFISEYTGGKIHKRQLEELVHRAAQDFDDFYETRHDTALTDQKAGSLLVASVDGKGIVMRTEDLREQTRKAAKARTHKMDKRLSKGEKKNAKRMATVATVYTVAPFVRTPEDVMAEADCRLSRKPRPKAEQKRVWASIEKEPDQVISQALEEAFYRDPLGEKNWVVLVDGNKPQIRHFKRIAKEKGLDLTIIIDIVHVIEYLWKAGRAFHPKSGPELQDWVRHRILEVLRGKAGLVAGGMRRSATRRKMSEKDREPVDTCARYLHTYSPYLRYHDYLAQGLPIATGVIEGACRHLVKDRMDVTGARWSLLGAEAVLRLRALRSSNDFGQYWDFHETREYERNHQALYAGGVVPPTIAPFSTAIHPRLKVIK
jgi:hypothetical protein